MLQSFTARVGKVIETKIPVEAADEKDLGDEKLIEDDKPIKDPKPICDEKPLVEKVPVAFVELEVSPEQQDGTPRVVSTLMQAFATRGKSSGQLLRFKDGVTAHMLFDLGFVRRLKPGTLLRFEWEARLDGIMGNLIAVARRE